MFLDEGVDLPARQIHVAAHRLDEIVTVLERARLPSVPEQRDVLVVQRLHDEVGDDASVVRMHVRPVGVEDAHHTHIDTILPPLVGGKSLGTALALVIAAADSDSVDISPVSLDLRMYQRITVNLAR